MEKLNVAEMRQVEGGESVIYVCKCGYTCTTRRKCVAHMILKHPGVVLDLWWKLFRVCKNFA